MDYIEIEYSEIQVVQAVYSQTVISYMINLEHEYLNRFPQIPHRK